MAMTRVLTSLHFISFSQMLPVFEIPPRQSHDERTPIPHDLLVNTLPVPVQHETHANTDGDESDHDQPAKRPHYSTLSGHWTDGSSTCKSAVSNLVTDGRERCYRISRCAIPVLEMGSGHVFADTPFSEKVTKRLCDDKDHD